MRHLKIINCEKAERIFVKLESRGVLYEFFYYLFQTILRVVVNLFYHLYCTEILLQLETRESLVHPKIW